MEFQPSLDRFGGEKAADAYYNALDAAFERKLRSVTCEECHKYFAAPIPTKVGFCTESCEYVFGDTVPADVGCEVFEDA